MVTITERAANKAIELAKAENIMPCALRVRIVGGGCAGFSYDLSLDDIGPNESDETYSQHDVTLIVDPVSNTYVDGTEIDYVVTDVDEGFKFNNPNAVGTCGCGSSFTA